MGKLCCLIKLGYQKIPRNAKNERLGYRVTANKQFCMESLNLLEREAILIEVTADH